MDRKRHTRHRKRIGLLGAGISIILLLFIATPLAVIISISDSEPLVVQAASIDAGSVIRAKKTGKQALKNILASEPARRYQLTFSEDEINSIVALATRGVKGFTGRVNVTPIGVKGAFSLHTPKNPFGAYVNMTVTIDPSPRGLVINNVSIGSLKIPGGFVMTLSEVLLNRLLSGDAPGTALVTSVESLQVDKTNLTLVYHNIHGLENMINKTIEQAKNIRDELAILGDPKIIKLYYEELCSFHKNVNSTSKTSLGFYLAIAFSLAERRSVIYENPGEENQAALLALAIFLGSKDFDSVIGAIDKETYQACKVRGRKVVLENRKDLRQHFIYSAALKVITDSGVSFTIGEFKEIMDSGSGGSGFSFPDLAADRAGIRFAELALDAQGAGHLQRMASDLKQEKAFFPAIAGLPEGVPLHLFEQQGGIDSDYYKKHLSVIEERINELPLYRPR